jgi:hypothetical protein
LTNTNCEHEDDSDEIFPIEEWLLLFSLEACFVAVEQASDLEN